MKIISNDLRSSCRALLLEALQTDSITITENGTYYASDHELEGFDIVYVNVEGNTGEEYTFPDGTPLDDITNVTGEDEVIDNDSDWKASIQLKIRYNYMSDGSIWGDYYGFIIKYTPPGSTNQSSIYRQAAVGYYSVGSGMPSYPVKNFKWTVDPETGTLSWSCMKPNSAGVYTYYSSSVTYSFLVGYGAEDHSISVKKKED